MQMLKLICEKCGRGFQYSRPVPTCLGCQPPPPAVVATGEANWQAIAPASAKVQDDLRKPGANAIFNDFASFCAPKRGLWVFGPCRTGKTWLAWRVLRIQARAGKSIACLKAVSFSFADNEKIGEFKRCGILMIDDIDKIANTEKSIAGLFDVVDFRVENNLPMIITSNNSIKTWTASLESVAERFAPSFEGRLNEVMKECVLK